MCFSLILSSAVLLLIISWYYWFTLSSLRYAWLTFYTFLRHPVHGFRLNFNVSLDLSTIYFAHFSGCWACFVYGCYSCYSIPECYNLFSGVKLSRRRSFCFIYLNWERVAKELDNSFCIKFIQFGIGLFRLDIHEVGIYRCWGQRDKRFLPRIKYTVCQSNYYTERYTHVLQIFTCFFFQAKIYRIIQLITHSLWYS